MFRQLLEKIQFGSLFQAVEHCGSSDAPVFYAFGTKLKKGELEYAFAKVENSFDIICGHLKKERQVYLIINNQQVLSNVVRQDGKAPLELVATAFPDISLDEFYYEVLPARKDALISVCRKEIIENLIDAYRKKSLHVIGWSIGASGIGQLENYLSDGVYKLRDYEWENRNGNISAISEIVSEPSELSGLSYVIEGITVEGQFLLALSGAVRSYTNYNPKTFGNFGNGIAGQRESFIQEQYFRKGKLAAVFLLLLVAMANALIFSYYEKSIERIEIKSNISNQQQANVTARALSVRQKQKRFEDVIGSSSSSVSLYIDQLLEDIPESIGLNKIEYQPIPRKLRDNKPIELQDNVMTISGQALNKEDLASWVSKLEEYSFIDTLEMEIEQERNREFFTLIISLNQ